MTARVVPLRSREAGDPRMGGTIDERVAAVAVLSEAAWKAAGRPFPTYTRATMPVRITTLAEQSDAIEGV
jgi:hypothetical protein